MTASFRFCIVEFQAGTDLVITRFADGTEAHACPHETPEYHAHALEKTGIDDTMLYCWQHDLMHVIYGEMNGGPSRVLWAVAHGLSTDTAECQAEEEEVQKLQVCLQRGRRPAGA